MYRGSRMFVFKKVYDNLLTVKYFRFLNVHCNTGYLSLRFKSGKRLTVIFINDKFKSSVILYQMIWKSRRVHTCLCKNRYIRRYVWHHKSKKLRTISKEQFFGVMSFHGYFSGMQRQKKITTRFLTFIYTKLYIYEEKS